MTPNNNQIVSSIAVFLFIGTSVASIVFELFGRDAEAKKTDILNTILQKTAPVAAAQELNSLPPGRQTCERRMNGAPIIITKDPQVADYIFNGSSRRNYRLRPASEEGLKKLGMLYSGLIWNNDVPKWQKIRDCFQKALRATNLKKAESVIGNEAISVLFQTKENGDTGVDLLEICRRLTFRATLRVFFGIDSSDFFTLGIDEAGFIASIVAFFKAWEYFLLRPERHWEDAMSKQHSIAVYNLQSHVHKMLKAIDNHDKQDISPFEGMNGSTDSAGSKGDTPTDTAPRLFVEHLREVCDQETDSEDLFLQSCLEMLLAGTDTSSVTAYYTLLAIAADKGLQKDLREDMREGKKKDGAVCAPTLLESVVNETLRFKPVGPVVLREAEHIDLKFPDKSVSVEKGTAILVHLAEMNLDKDVWPNNPRKFLPRRFLNAPPNQKNFFPFGMGPKGCVGMHLGRYEVHAIVQTVLKYYDLEIVGSETLESLETHWDIANQPDEPVRIRLNELDS